MLRRAVALMAVTLAGINGAAGQERRAAAMDSSGGADSVTVRAGARYGAGPIVRLLLGSEYRDAWTRPITVPVLRPATFAGGLTVIERGGGRQTQSLVFLGGDGRTYVFRSVDKKQRGGLPEDVHGTLIEVIAQDDVTAKFPGASLVVAPLLEAAGVLHATPTLAVMADHPALGEFRAEFAGMLGNIEERAVGGGGVGGIGHYERIISSEKLLERLEASAADRVDARAYLAARLMDLLVGDWDRHPDQWRWAQVDRDEVRYWLPIPRDRDNAFSTIGGLTAVISGMLGATGVHFDENYASLRGLTHNAQVLDMAILAELARPVWDSVAATLQARISDSVITVAINALPDGYRALNGESLARTLRARRNALSVAARGFYEQLAGQVEIFGTDQPDQATIDEGSDGTVRVRLGPAGRGDSVYFDRRFLPTETREIRVYLRGGPDTAVVRGSATSIAVRVIGGGGDDMLADSVDRRGSAFVGFYDDRGNNAFVKSSHTGIDRRPFTKPNVKVVGDNNPPPARDRGAHGSVFTGYAAWPVGVGPVIGGGPRWTRYGFRRFPYAAGGGFTFQYAPTVGRIGVAGDLRVIETGGRSETRLTALASQISRTRFSGYGNESAPGINIDINRVWATEYRIAARRTDSLAAHLRLGTGPVVSYLNPEPGAGSAADLVRPVGSRSFGVAGFAVELEYDRRDSNAYTRNGFRLVARAAGYPLVWGDAHEAFWRGDITAWGYTPIPFPLETTLALRIAGARVWGNAPFQYAAFLGGSTNLRGYDQDRFAGQSALNGTIELRTKLAHANLLLISGDLGMMALADAGRVFVASETSTLWHHGIGGGLWFGALDRSALVHLVYVVGERSMVGVRVGMPF